MRFAHAKTIYVPRQDSLQIPSCHRSLQPRKPDGPGAQRHRPRLQCRHRQSGCDSTAAIPSLTGELVPKFLLKWRKPWALHGKPHASRPVAVESVIGACLVIRRSGLADLGKLDEDYFFFLEETEWCQRARRLGFEVYHIPAARAARPEANCPALSQRHPHRISAIETDFLSQNPGPSCLSAHIRYPADEGSHERALQQHCLHANLVPAESAARSCTRLLADRALACARATAKLGAA